MPGHSLFEIFIDPLNRHRIPYVVTGAVASIVYGEPRLTHDVDLVLELQTDTVEAILAEFPASEFYTPPPEIVLEEIRRIERGQFNIIHHETGLRADIYLVGQDTFSKWAIENFRKIEIGGNSYRIAPPEYVVIRKLEYFREGGSDKHLRDIRSILDLSAESIDLTLIRRHVAERSLKREWSRLDI